MTTTTMMKIYDYDDVDALGGGGFDERGLVSGYKDDLYRFRFVMCVTDKETRPAKR